MAMTDEELDALISEHFGAAVNAFGNGRMKTALQEIVADMRAGGGGGGVGLGETSSTAYRGDRGKTAYDHSQLTTGNPHNVTAAQIGASPVGHTHVSTSITDFTEAVQDAVAGLLGAGSNVILNYDDTAGTLSISATGEGGTGLSAEEVRDAIGVALVGIGNIAVTVNDAADTITFTTTATQNITDAASAALMDSKDAVVQASVNSKPTFYATVAALKAVRPDNGTIAITAGYAAAGDGGHGKYVFDSSSSSSDDGGIILLPSTGSGNGRWKQLPNQGEINARTFGVKLDWTTDDTTALQAAINACMFHEYDLYIPRGNARITAELTIGTASASSIYNQSSFKIRGAGISSDPNASEFPGAEGTQIRIEGTGHRSVIAFQESVWRYGQIEDLTVTAHTLGGAIYGILWTDSRHSQFKLRRVHAERVDRCFGELKGNGLNGEFIRFEDCGGTGEENFFFMDAGSGQAFGHYFEHCTGGVKDGGALFEIGGGGLGFGITLMDFHSSSIGSSAEVDPAYDTLTGVTFLRNHGISGYFKAINGRNEHVNTVIENISATYNEAGRIVFDNVEFDGMTCTNTRPAIKNTGGFAGAYGIRFSECSFNRFGFGNEDKGVFATSFHSIDASDILFDRCHFNFQYFNIRNSYFTRIDFKGCKKTTPGRPQPFSNHGEYQRDLSERDLVSNVFQAQGRPENFLKYSGFTIGSASAPSPWVNVGGNFSATVKAFPDAGVASWSSSPNARLLTFASATSVYQDITEVDFSSGEHQDLSGHTTGYFHAIVDAEAAYAGNIFEFSLENSVSGRIYDKQTIIVGDHLRLCSINLSAVDADGTGLMRVRIALISGSATPLRVYRMMATNDPSAVYTPTAASSVSFDHAWDLNTELLKVDGRLQLPVKADTLNNPANLPNHRAGEISWSSTLSAPVISNGTRNVVVLGFEKAATYADITADTTPRTVLVLADESISGSPKTTYMHDGTTLHLTAILPS